MDTLSIKKFSIRVVSVPSNKIAAIKALRELTGLGLKEAKEATEFLGAPQTFDITSSVTTDAYLESLLATLRATGIQVSSPGFEIIEELRRLGAQALTQGEDELAHEILQLVLAEKLRRKGEFSVG